MPKGDNIIQINDAICEVEFFQCVLHQALKGCRCITESKWHLDKLIETQITNGERSVLL